MTAPAAATLPDVDEIALDQVDPSSPEARAAMQCYFDELATRFPNGFDPGDALDAVGSYRAPAGAFVVARRGDEIVGCGAVQHLDESTSEIKRMWVSPATRGAGLGKRLLTHLEALAAAGGRTTVVLDTNGSLTEAIGMYLRTGYVEVEAYNDNPYAEHWFRKTL